MPIGGWALRPCGWTPRCRPVPGGGLRRRRQCRADLRRRAALRAAVRWRRAGPG